MANLHHDNPVNFPDALRLTIARASHDILSFEDVLTILSCANILSISEEPADPYHNGLYLYRNHDNTEYERVVWHEVYAETCPFRGFVMDVEISQKKFVVQPEGQLTFWRRVYNYDQFEDFVLVQNMVTRDVDYYLIGYSISSEGENDEDDQGDDDQGDDDHAEQGEDDHNQISEIAFSADVAAYRQQHQPGSTTIAPAAVVLPE